MEAVAIDGPAGSGKSTVARLISKELGYIYADTGAMYRAVGLYCLDNGIGIFDDESIIKALPLININIEFDNGVQRISLNDKDVTEEIRTQSVAEAASKVAAIPEVRELLVELQRKIAENNKVVMDGRDIGTNVLKNARVKIYLDAEVEERAKRRCNELSEKGISFDYNNIIKEIIQRDDYDKNRKVNPLSVAEDAVVIDTTGLSIEQVKNKILEITKRK
ncbi:MAG: (d)CMP kinase [Clostridia bacterium]|nr:(d)CMP kinase [Clostridia bacterium]